MLQEKLLLPKGFISSTFCTNGGVGFDHSNADEKKKNFKNFNSILTLPIQLTSGPAEGTNGFPIKGESLNCIPGILKIKALIF